MSVRFRIISTIAGNIMYKKILVPVDGSPASTLGLDEAIRLAKDQGAELRLLHVLNEWLAISPDASGAAAGAVIEGLRDSGNAVLDEADARARRGGVTANTVLLEQIGVPVGAVILKHGEEWGADLIVCGTHGRRGVRRMVMGSDAEYIVRHTRVPVLLVRQTEEPPKEQC